MAWDAPCDFGSVILELYLLSFTAEGEGGSAVTVAWDCAVTLRHWRRLGIAVAGFVAGRTVVREDRNVACMAAAAEVRV